MELNKRNFLRIDFIKSNSKNVTIYPPKETCYGVQQLMLDATSSHGAGNVTQPLLLLMQDSILDGMFTTPAAYIPLLLVVYLFFHPLRREDAAADVPNVVAPVPVVRGTLPTARLLPGYALLLLA